MGNRQPTPPLAILGLSHYHQRAGTQPNAVRIDRGHERVELMTGGRGWVEHGDGWVEVVPGSLVWQVEGDFTIGRSDPDNPYRCLSVTFKVKPGQPRRVARFTAWMDLPAVRAFTQELVGLWIRQTVPAEALAAYAFGRLLVQAVQGQELSARSLLPEPVRRAREAIEARFAARLDVAELADAAGCSTPYLHELFRKHLGCSPHQLILKLRLQEASRRLTSTHEPIKEIAAASGFAHAAAFCHAFRRHCGRTPAAYRRAAHRPA